MGNKVSIIIANYNRENLIASTLESVLTQTYSNWECIIVDDGSTDNSEAIVNSFAIKDERFRFLHRPSNRPKGPNAARNFGIENSVGEYILSLDSDDWILPEHLKMKLKIFENNPKLDMILSKTILVDNFRNIIGYENRTKLSANLLEDFITLKTSWYMHDTMWKKSFLQGKKLYNEDLLKWLDRDFHIRRLVERPSIYLLNEYLSLYRIHENSNSSNSNVEVMETRHQAVIDIVFLLKNKNILTSAMKIFFFKFQVQNLVVLYKSSNFLRLYLNLFKATYTFNFEYLKWMLKLFLGFISYKLTGKGLKLIK